MQQAPLLKVGLKMGVSYLSPSRAVEFSKSVPLWYLKSVEQQQP